MQALLCPSRGIEWSGNLERGVVGGGDGGGLMGKRREERAEQDGDGDFILSCHLQ